MTPSFEVVYGPGLPVQSSEPSLAQRSITAVVGVLVDRIADLTVAQLRPYHVQSWVDDKDCSPGHRGGCIGAIKRALNWARKFGYIDNNPIAFLEQPRV